MTLNQFLAKLRKTPRDWRLDGAKIRRGEHLGFYECPITCFTRERASEYPFVARKLHLSKRIANAIASASDNMPEMERNLRQRLLKACGLKP